MSTREQHWHELRDGSVKEYLAKKFNVPLVKPHPDAVNHAAYLKAIDSSKAIVCTGPAGTGKTYMACGKAVEYLRSGRVKRIVLTRPLQECGQGLGYLPGDIYAKVVDMMIPLIESLEEFTSAKEVEEMRADGRLVICPMEKMRGRTMKDAFVILDEAQNATFTQLKMLVTRFGANSKLVVCGDYTQSDLPYRGHNSLWELVHRFRQMPFWHPAVALVSMTRDDIVRDELVRWFVDATEGAFDPAKPVQQEGVLATVGCPECGNDFRYEQSWADERLVECPHCHELVELHDEAGRLDPFVIEDPDDDDILAAVCGLPVAA